MIDSKYFQEKLDEENLLNSRREEMKAEIRSSPYVESLTEKYRIKDVDSFADWLVGRKINLLKSEKFLLEEWDKHHLQYITYAHKLLELILSKKLFNLECQWRAEEISIPEIKTTSDFAYWSRDISNCPFLEPIVEKEIEVLKMFLQSNNFEIKNWTWERGLDYDFEEFIQKNHKGDLDQLPEFYEFYDGMMGTFYLLNKPDYRNEKEQKYIKICFADRFEKAEKRSAEPDQPKPLGHFSAYGSEGDDILKQTEPEDFGELLEAVSGSDLNEYCHYQGLKDIFDYLMRCREEIHLPSWLMWDEAMEYVYNRHRNEKALDVLDLALEEYRMKAELGLFDTTEVENKTAECWTRKYILKGRKIAGEPEDFEF